MRRHSLGLWIVIIAVAAAVSGCAQEPGEPSAAEKALAELQNKYEELVQERVSDPVQWASEDLENLGDWEYRIEDLPLDAPDVMVDKLNKFGNERWEVYWVQENDAGMRFFLKRPSISYLSRIPLSQLGRYVIGVPGDGQ